jgi:hypothetical protein
LPIIVYPFSQGLPLGIEGMSLGEGAGDPAVTPKEMGSDVDDEGTA